MRIPLSTGVRQPLMILWSNTRLKSNIFSLFAHFQLAVSLPNRPSRRG
jgi:hypothetical protein